MTTHICITFWFHSPCHLRGCELSIQQRPQLSIPCSWHIIIQKFKHFFLLLNEWDFQTPLDK